jgi:hypothetical protein
MTTNSPVSKAAMFWLSKEAVGADGPTDSQERESARRLWIVETVRHFSLDEMNPQKIVFERRIALPRQQAAL